MIGLSAEEIQFYHQNGYIAPINILTAKYKMFSGFEKHIIKASTQYDLVKRKVAGCGALPPP